RLASAQAVVPSWSYTGSLNTARTVSSATLLPNGKVLVAAGYGLAGPPFNSAELYDPASGTWNSTGSLNTKRFGHTATLLPNGKVLVVGGSNIGSNYVSGILSADSVEPATATWRRTVKPNIG